MASKSADAGSTKTTDKEPVKSADKVEKDPKDDKSAGGKGFMFDIVVIRLDIPTMPKNNQSKLKVDVDFNGTELSITSSRINVLDFKDGRSHEFVAKPLNLKDELAKNPLKFKLSDDQTVLGNGTLKWPEQFLLNLIECAGQMTHSDEIEILESNGAVTATIQVFMRLQPTCEEYVEHNTIDEKCRNAHKEIRPNDILFMVGEDKNPCCCSQVGFIPASDSEETLNPKCLDLSNFRAVNCQTVSSNTNILSTLDPACQGLKAITNHYQKLIDSVMGKKKLLSKCKTLSYGQEQNQSETFSAQYSGFDQKPSFCSSESYNEIPWRCQPYPRGDFEGDSIIQVAHKDKPPNLIENIPEVSRNCPLCKEDMSFLPKLATCPKCCYKPLPYFEEKPYNDNQTADQLLEQSIDTNHDSDSNTKVQPTAGCRCTCKHGKICAYCRIRVLCGDVFKSTPKKQPENIPEPRSSEADCCASSVDDRPFLTRVFSEFRDLYDLKDTNKRCEKELKELKEPKKLEPREHAAPHKSETDHLNNMLEKKGELENKKQSKSGRAKKRCMKPAADKILKSRLYDYQTVHANNPAHIRHKTCINSFAGNKNVPPNMGWLWNANNNGKWKPGSICKPIKELMRYFLKDYPADTLLVSRYSYRKKRKSEENQQFPILVQKPTLHICKKNGEYVITMRPLKDPETLKKAADPYENMKPVKFRITKNPQLIEMRKLKQSLKELGFRKCTCHKPITYCFCRSFLDKKKLEFECNRECRKRNLPSCVDTLVLSDTSESEGEFDFGVTPPVGVIKPERLIKPNLVNESTQYVESDWNKTPLFPKAPNKYMVMYQCAVGERKGGKASGSGASGGGGGGIGGAGGKGSGKCPGGVGGSRGEGKGGGMAIDFSGKYGGRGGLGLRKPAEEEKAPEKPFDMMKYMKQANKRHKMTSAEAAAKRKEQMRLLRGVSPPLLCTIDRRGKPCDPCAPVFSCGENRIC